MENQTYSGMETDVAGLEAEFEAGRREAMKLSRFRQIEDGKTAQLSFTGKAFKRATQGTDDAGVAYRAEKIDWELADMVTEGDNAGTHKLFSVGARNRVNREILSNVKAGHLIMLVSRKGSGKSTKYEVTTPE